MLPFENLEKTVPFMLETPFFEELEPSEVKQILPIMEVKELPTGDVVFKEGDPGDAWYILFAGEVVALKGSGGCERVVNMLEPRACFGEMAILDGSARSATVKVTRDATVFRFPRAEFFNLLDNDNIAAYKLVYQMALSLSQRHRALTDRLVGLLQEDAGTEVKKK